MGGAVIGRRYITISDRESHYIQLARKYIERELEFKELGFVS